MATRQARKPRATPARGVTLLILNVLIVGAGVGCFVLVAMFPDLADQTTILGPVTFSQMLGAFGGVLLVFAVIGLVRGIRMLVQAGQPGS